MSTFTVIELKQLVVNEAKRNPTWNQDCRENGCLRRGKALCHTCNYKNTISSQQHICFSILKDFERRRGFPYLKSQLLELSEIELYHISVMLGFSKVSYADREELINYILKNQKGKQFGEEFVNTGFSTCS